MNKKVEITISENDFRGEPNHYVESVKNGAPYTSVDYGSNKGVKYGGGSPCDNLEEINSSVENAKAIIEKEGDKWIIVDKRDSATLKKGL